MIKMAEELEVGRGLKPDVQLLLQGHVAVPDVLVPEEVSQEVNKAQVKDANRAQHQIASTSQHPTSMAVGGVVDDGDGGGIGGDHGSGVRAPVSIVDSIRRITTQSRAQQTACERWQGAEICGI